MIILSHKLAKLFKFSVFSCISVAYQSNKDDNGEAIKMNVPCGTILKKTRKTSFYFALGRFDKEAALI